MWKQTDERPEIGKRIVALYRDHSGASLFLTRADGLQEADGYLRDWNHFQAFKLWAYLPDGFSLDFEPF